MKCLRVLPDGRGRVKVTCARSWPAQLVTRLIEESRFIQGEGGQPLAVDFVEDSIDLRAHALAGIRRGRDIDFVGTGCGSSFVRALQPARRLHFRPVLRIEPTGLV